MSAVCPWHGVPLGPDTPPCGECEAFMRGPLPESAEDKAAEIRRWSDNLLTVPFSVLHERFERLLDRPVWTHELAQTDYLVHEVLTGIRPSMEGVLAKLPHDKPVIVVDGGEAVK